MPIPINSHEIRKLSTQNTENIILFEENLSQRPLKTDSSTPTPSTSFHQKKIEKHVSGAERQPGSPSTQVINGLTKEGPFIRSVASKHLPGQLVSMQ